MYKEVFIRVHTRPSGWSISLQHMKHIIYKQNSAIIRKFFGLIIHPEYKFKIIFLIKMCISALNISFRLIHDKSFVCQAGFSVMRNIYSKNVSLVKIYINIICTIQSYDAFMTKYIAEFHLCC